MPGKDRPVSDYDGLRKSCRQLREEYDHEAEKLIGDHMYEQNPLLLAKDWDVAFNLFKPLTTRMPDMADMATVELHPPTMVVNRMARFPKKLVPWHWPWVKTLVINFDMSWRSAIEDSDDDIMERDIYSEVSLAAYRRATDDERLRPYKDRFVHKAVRMAYHHMDKIIKDRTGTTVRRRTFSKGDRRPVKCDIDTFVLRWRNFKNEVIVLPPALGLPSNHDRLWDVTFGFADNGGFIQAAWRRRTQADAERDAEEDFMPLPGWLFPVLQ
jgi:hypothetical protein